MENIQISTTHEKMTKVSNFSSEEIAVIQNTVAKGTTATELAYFLQVAKSTGLNPFIKQIWCYKDNKGNVIILAGRDGFLAIAQKNPKWNGMVSSEVGSNDTFNVDVINGVIEHKPNYNDRGTLIGAYCLIKPKGVDVATYEWADIKTYDKNQFIWNSHKTEMIKKVAEVHALKKAFGISGIYCEDEMIIEAQVESTANWRDKIKKPEQIEETEQQKEWRLKLESIKTGRELTEYLIDSNIDEDIDQRNEDPYFSQLVVSCKNRIANDSAK